MTTAKEVEQQIHSHEEICAERYATIHARLDRIEGMLNKLIWALVAGFIGLLVTTISSEIKAEEAELPQLMATPTDVGFIYLSVDPCPQDFGPFYEYFTVATEDGQPPHLGCWNVDGPLVIVWWFELNEPVSYDKFEFKPWDGPAPTL